MKKGPLSYRTYHDIYALLLFVNLFGVLAFGVRPGVAAILQKRAFLSQIEEKNALFSRLVESAGKSEQTYLAAQPYFSSLDKAYPVTVRGEQLIRDLVSIAGSSGYILTSASFSTKEDTVISADISLEGEFSNLPRLLEAVDSYQRSLKVEDVNVNFSQGKVKEGRVILSVGLKVFSLKGDLER